MRQMDRARRKFGRRARRLGMTEFQLAVCEMLTPAILEARAKAKPRVHGIYKPPGIGFDLRAGSATLSTFVYDDPLG